jgi:hypothetical protein
VAELVAARNRISQPDAQKRVDDVIAQLKVAETKAREAADSATLQRRLKIRGG